jgi:hypothetical protein
MPGRKPQSAFSATEAAGAGGQPEVIVDFLFDHGLFHVAVINIGEAPAYSVSVKFDKTFRGLGGTQDVSALPLFRRIKFLAPHRQIETFLDTSSAYFRRGEPTRLTAVISFRDARRRPYERRIAHDLSIYKNVAYVLPPAGTNPPAIPSPCPQPNPPPTGEPIHGHP